MTRLLSDISKDLHKLARGDSPGEKALRDLAVTLTRTNRAELAGVDLAKNYDPAVMLPEDAPWLRRLAGGLELFRDLLIFVPIIYTWFKISDALVAYNSYQGTAPFMLAWQQGFDNGTEPLSASATVVAVVVLAVIGLTLIAHMVRGRYGLRVQKRQQELAVLLGEASVRLARVPLTDVSVTDLGTIGTQVATSSQLLRTALEKSSKDITAAVNTNPGSKLHDMFEKWTAAAEELTKLGARLASTQESVDQLRAVQTALTGMATQIGEETKRLLTALETERTLSRHEAHAHHELATEVSQSTKLLGESLKGLNERAEQFNELILRLRHVVTHMDSSNGYQ
ncbi:hypothetical protein [Actinocrispum wychmicini]|uniref:Uncharacterized protein n=1 Tax=Actinocrispum wychmicini TaxID=1213861 RepID=A0A4R2J449_9PSEU|nr:hypothetical protein [Actinocrispum wychmicini]TCO52874.1 hypothetical protein EV192_11168 [Actinocrispum wychmicini]